jgi:hypothetical protein
MTLTIISVYADDTNISVRSGSVDVAVRKLNAAIGLLEPWFRKWRIMINTKNCTITLFSKQLCRYRRSTRPVQIFNEITAWTNKTKYLGLTLDLKLIQRAHICCILRKANYRLRQLFPILNKSSTININLELVIYKSLLRSVLTYASPLWGCATNTFFFLWRYSPNLGLGLPPLNSSFHLGLLDLWHLVGLLGWVISSSQCPYLYTHRKTHTH